MVLVEVSVLNKEFLINLDDGMTVQDLGERALQQFKLCHPADKPRKVLYMQDSKGVILSAELDVVKNSLHTSRNKLICVVEYCSAALTSADMTEVEAAYRDWQMWTATQIFSMIDANSLGNSAYKPPAALSNLLSELYLAPNEQIQMNCLRSMLLLASRCDDEALVTSNINNCINLFRSTYFPNICIDILTHLNRMIYRGIRYFDDLKIEVLFHLMDIDAAYIKFPSHQPRLHSLFESLRRSDRLSNDEVLALKTKALYSQAQAKLPSPDIHTGLRLDPLTTTAKLHSKLERDANSDNSNSNSNNPSSTDLSDLITDETQLEKSVEKMVNLTALTNDPSVRRYALMRVFDLLSMAGVSVSDGDSWTPLIATSASGRFRPYDVQRLELLLSSHQSVLPTLISNLLDNLKASIYISRTKKTGAEKKADSKVEDKEAKGGEGAGSSKAEGPPPPAAASLISNATPSSISGLKSSKAFEIINRSLANQQSDVPLIKVILKCLVILARIKASDVDTIRALVLAESKNQGENKEVKETDTKSESGLGLGLGRDKDAVLSNSQFLMCHNILLLVVTQCTSYRLLVTLSHSMDNEIVENSAFLASLYIDKVIETKLVIAKGPRTFTKPASVTTTTPAVTAVTTVTASGPSSSSDARAVSLADLRSFETGNNVLLEQAVLKAESGDSKINIEPCALIDFLDAGLSKFEVMADGSTRRININTTSSTFISPTPQINSKKVSSACFSLALAFLRYKLMAYTTCFNARLASLLASNSQRSPPDPYLTELFGDKAYSMKIITAVLIEWLHLDKYPSLQAYAITTIGVICFHFKALIPLLIRFNIVSKLLDIVRGSLTFVEYSERSFVIMDLLMEPEASRTSVTNKCQERDTDLFSLRAILFTISQVFLLKASAASTAATMQQQQQGGGARYPSAKSEHLAIASMLQDAVCAFAEGRQMRLQDVVNLDEACSVLFELMTGL